MPKKRALETPVEIRNEIDEDFMGLQFQIRGHWFWIPERLYEMTQELSRESILSREDIIRLSEQSKYKIDLNTGSIINTNTGVDLKLNKSGPYARITLYLDKAEHPYNHHGIICLMKYGLRPTMTHTVDHIDRQKTNNHHSNLRYATKSEQRKNQPEKTKMIPRDLVVGFNESNYVAVKWIIVHGQILPFEPKLKTRSIHLCPKGTHVVINKTFIGRVFFVKQYPAIGYNDHNIELHRLMYINTHECESIRVIDHIDNDPTNWAADNLRECTASENSKAAHREQDAHPIKCRIEIQNKNTNAIEIFRSKREFGEALGLKPYQLDYNEIGEEFGDYKIICMEHHTAVTCNRAVTCNGIRFKSMIDCAKHLRSIYLQHLTLKQVSSGIRQYLSRKPNTLYKKQFKIIYADKLMH